MDDLLKSIRGISHSKNHLFYYSDYQVIFILKNLKEEKMKYLLKGKREQITLNKDIDALQSELDKRLLIASINAKVRHPKLFLTDSNIFKR